MKNYVTALLILAVGGIVWAADAPNPLPQGDAVNQGRDRAMNQRGEKGEIRERFAERHEEYIKWLEKNYPDEAKKLAAVKEQDPDRYLHELKESFEKYGRLARAEKKNPEMAKLLREDIELKAQIENKLSEIHAAEAEKQKTKLTDELRQLIDRRFDNIVAQKQLRYQGLNKKLEELKKEVQKQESDLDKLKARKSEEVKKRVDELINESEKIDWD